MRDFIPEWNVFVPAVLLALCASLASLAKAEEITASGLKTKMSDKEQYHYIAGVVAGLATARFVRDGNEEGSRCIQSWFHDTPDIRDTIEQAFARFGDKSPSAIILALAVRKCGK